MADVFIPMSYLVGLLNFKHWTYAMLMQLKYGQRSRPLLHELKQTRPKLS